MKRLGIAMLAGLCTWASAAPPASEPAGREWHFVVSLDDKPIGEHRFTLQERDGERLLLSTARFDVKLFGFTVYRYRHRATERWRGDCLSALEADTDDNGKTSQVNARLQAGRLQVDGPQGDAALPACVMSFAYWNPAMLRQTQLLNAQNGRYEAVTIRRLPDGPGAQQRHRIDGLANPLELLYSAEGDWLGLDSTVAGGRRLRYRLR
ncbi:DUF6134 family protein [Ideonella sp. BN130291]|uniref:DUF6134 family protein n=1 Tax=Ideonella sp. BN130291 TaxID=3112940 RepID=UPI002E25E1C6|nr:DUF6134 family protein [Ideonella sp. BN130291]